MANPPFMSPKGGIRPHHRFAIQATRSEVLFVDYIAEHLRGSGRAGVIVPEGIIFQSQNAYKALRKMLVEGYLWGVISLPGGVFNPYSGVKTSILLLDKGLSRRTDEILFVKLSADGFGLGAQRRPVEGSDLPEAEHAVAAWRAGAPLPTGGIAHAVSRKRILESADIGLSGDRYLENGLRASVHWPMVKVGDICQFTSGLWKGEKQPLKLVRIIRNTNFTKTGLLDLADVAEHEVEERQLLTRILQPGDILLEKSGGGPTQPVGRVVYFGEISGEYSFSNFVARLRITSDEVNARYLWYALNHFYQTGGTNLLQKQTSGIRNLDMGAYREVSFPLPPLDVQREVVAELDGYRKIIEGARQVIANYKPTIKVDPKWPRVKIGDVCEVKSGGTPSRAEGKYWNGSIPWVGSTVCKDDIVQGAQEFITEAGLSKSAAKLFRSGTTLIALVGATIGRTGFLTFDCCTNQNVAGLFPLDQTILHQKYLFRAAQALYPRFLELGEGKFRMANLSFVREQGIALPDLSTQREIVAELDAERALIDGNRQLIERFERKIQERLGEIWGEGQ